jgi:hypothetical protein
MVGITIFVTERDGTNQGQRLGSHEGYLATLGEYGVICLMQNGIKVRDFGSLEDKAKYTLGPDAASLPPLQPNGKLRCCFVFLYLNVASNTEINLYSRIRTFLFIFLTDCHSDHSPLCSKRSNDTDGAWSIYTEKQGHF